MHNAISSLVRYSLLRKLSVYGIYTMIEKGIYQVMDTIIVQ
uniref:Uncharacterized protein n=1 Tax=Setaria italica TaxID=4555 RepID=K3ZFQ4_SETIT